MQTISIGDFDYDLPDDRIAKYPLPTRDSSKLLVYNKGEIKDDIFSNLDFYLPENSLMIYNDTRVIQARLIFQKKSGTKIEIFCLEPLNEDYLGIFQKKNSCEWKCLVGNLKKWKEAQLKIEFSINKETVELTATIVDSSNNFNIIRFDWQPEKFNFGEIMEHLGKTPIPPYLKRPSEEIDRTRYQTIYSTQNGSVAAPTAGLHFTPTVFDKLDQKNININNLTLHVGAGTFVPVKNKDVSHHAMHSELFIVKKELLELLSHYQGNLTAVGTTTLRALESIYWIGVKIIGQLKNPFEIEQWEVYKLPGRYSVEKILEVLVNYCNENNTEAITAKTKLLVVPGYDFKMVQRVITNFHQPRSTLLLLVAAFVGKNNWREIYNYALSGNFRFLSYGDSSLLIR
jgi:S-adenosylmethionine:tRNA ribosyltransferase-isomerase